MLVNKSTPHFRGSQGPIMEIFGQIHGPLLATTAAALSYSSLVHALRARN